MANSHYYRARAKWAKKQLDWAADDMRALLASDAYVVDLGAHEFLSSVPAPARFGIVALTGRAVVATDGRCTAASPIVFTGVPSSGVAKALILLKYDTATPENSALLVYMDKAVSGLPLTMTGAPVNVTLPAAGLFVL